MSRNGSGTYTAPSNGWNPAVDGTVITAADWSAILADLSTALSQSIASDGQTPTTAAIPFAQGISVSSGSLATPSIAFLADSATGLYRAGSNTLGIAANGISVLTASPTGITIPLNLTLSGTFTPPAQSITNASLANVPTATFKGRVTAATGVPEDLTATQATSLLNAVVGDSGSGGTKGLVPAPAAGDAALGKVLGAGGTFVVAMPAGAIVAFGMSTVPTGWLYCNGQAVSRTTYARLFAAISTTFGSGDGSTTFNVPDLRGYFARGWDDGRGVDSGRVFGSLQADELKAHTHTVPAQSNANSGTFVEDADGSGSPQTVNTGSTGGAETRPVNIALTYFIKD